MATSEAADKAENLSDLRTEFEKFKAAMNPKNSRIGKTKMKSAKGAPPNKANWMLRCELCAIEIKDFGPNMRMRCEDCQQNLKEWEDAESWVNLLDYNRDFIEGGRTATPYSIFPLFTDESLWPGLFLLHEYGILVTDAQPEYHIVDFDEYDGKWFEIKERPYLRCVIPTNLKSLPSSMVDVMLDSLLKNPLLEVVTYYEYTDYAAGKWFRGFGYRCAPPLSARKIPAEKIPKYQCFRSSVGPSMTGRTVSKHRVADTKEGLAWQKWKRCKQNVLPVITERDIAPKSQGIRAFGRQTKVTSSMLPVIFTVAAREWTEVGLDLVEIVRFACEDAGMEPIFEEVEDADDEGLGPPINDTDVIGTGVVGTGTGEFVNPCEKCRAAHAGADSTVGQMPLSEMPPLEKLSVDEVD